MINDSAWKWNFSPVEGYKSLKAAKVCRRTETNFQSARKTLSARQWDILLKRDCF